MLFDFADTTNRNVYGLRVAIIGPRPAARVATRDTDGTVNAAPYSFCNAISGDPPVLAFGIAWPAAMPRQARPGNRSRTTPAQTAA